MAERPLPTTTQRDPYGKIECSHCVELGTPPGGILWSHVGHTVTQSHQLPEGWALRDFVFLCPTCARLPV